LNLCGLNYATFYIIVLIKLEVINVIVKVFYFSDVGNSLLPGRRIVTQIKEAELLPVVCLYGGTPEKD